MKSASFIAGPKTAKRKIQIREYIASTYEKEKELSNPFEDESDDIDESQWKIKPLRLKCKKNYQFFEESDDESDGYFSQPDDILIKSPDLDEADKFIASLKFPTKKKNSKKDKLEKTDILYKSSITPEDIILFKTESEKLKALMQEESIIDMESDEDLLI